jgi:hypothetical protein
MGWNLHLSIVRGRTTADFAALGMFGLADEAITVEAATSLPSPAVAQAGEDLLFVDGGMVATEFSAVLAAKLRAEVVTGIFSSVTDTYVWNVVQPDGSFRGLSVSGGVTKEEGTPTPEEEGIGVLDEDTLFELLDRRTGLDDDWLDLPAYPLAGAAAPPKKRRGLFRR